MNSTIENIMGRRSIRFYTDREITRSELETIISAGNAAPTGSGGNWRFVVVNNRDKIKKLSEITKPYYDGFMNHAPEGFRRIRAQIDAVAEDPFYYSPSAAVFVISSAQTANFDCPMVCQNMMVAAKSLELGSCWVYFGQIASEHPEFQELLQMKEGEQIFGPIVLGEPSSKQPPLQKRPDPVIQWS